jgi:hypothetical protein
MSAYEAGNRWLIKSHVRTDCIFLEKPLYSVVKTIRRRGIKGADAFDATNFAIALMKNRI